MTLISIVNLDVEYCHYNMWTGRCRVCGAALSLPADMGAILSVFLLCSFLKAVGESWTTASWLCEALCCGGLLQTMLFNWAVLVLPWLLPISECWEHDVTAAFLVYTSLRSRILGTENQTRGLVCGDKWHCFWTSNLVSNAEVFLNILICTYFYSENSLRLQLSLNPTNGDAHQSFW